MRDDQDFQHLLTLLWVYQVVATVMFRQREHQYGSGVSSHSHSTRSVLLILWDHFRSNVILFLKYISYDSSSSTGTLWQYKIDIIILASLFFKTTLGGGLVYIGGSVCL